MIVFFCSTPYQILLSINIKFVNHKEEKADIYILNHFLNAPYIVKNLKKNNIFNRVQLVDAIGFTNSFSENSINRYLQKISTYLQSYKIMKKYFDFDNQIYDAVYLTYPDIIIQTAIKELYKHNNDMDVHLFEDGTGSYNNHIMITSKYKKWFNKIMRLDKVLDKYDSLMLFNPELYSGNSSIPIESIPHIDSNSELREILNITFGYDEDQKIDEKIIFLDQPVGHINGLSEQIKEVICEILENDYIIKLHPRSHSNDFPNYNTYQNNAVPWEIMSLNNNIEDKVLISYFSTAAISSKIIFDKEPKIIFLYEMEELTKINKMSNEQKEFVNKVKDTYRDISRVMIPRNLGELKKCISEALKN